MSTNVDANELYDPANNKWTILQPMLSKRGGLASATAVNETIYVFGGEQPSGTFNNNEKYDPDTNKWISQEPMPTARHGLSAVAANDGKIYVIGGGREPGGSGSNLNEIFHVR